jgi:hypothetical protein
MLWQGGMFPDAHPWDRSFQPCRDEAAHDKVAKKDAEGGARLFATGAATRRSLLLHKLSDGFSSQRRPFRHAGVKGEDKESPRKIKIFAARPHSGSADAFQVLLIVSQDLLGWGGWSHHLMRRGDALLSQQAEQMLETNGLVWWGSARVGANLPAFQGGDIMGDDFFIDS